MDRVRQQDHVGVRAWIQPQRRPGEAGMSEAPDREDLASSLGERRIDIPTKAAQTLSRDRRMTVQQSWTATAATLVGCLDLVCRMAGLLQEPSSAPKSLASKEIRSGVPQADPVATAQRRRHRAPSRTHRRARPPRPSAAPSCPAPCRAADSQGLGSCSGRLGFPRRVLSARCAAADRYPKCLTDIRPAVAREPRQSPRL